MEIVEYLTESEESPFGPWFDDLNEDVAAKVDVRLRRAPAEFDRTSERVLAGLQASEKEERHELDTGSRLKVPLTKRYKERVLKRIQNRPGFAKELFAEAINSLLSGQGGVCRSILRDLVNACVTFKTLEEETGIPEKSLHRMLSKDGNPRLDNLIKVLRAVADQINVRGEYCVSQDSELMEA